MSTIRTISDRSDRSTESPWLGWPWLGSTSPSVMNRNKGHPFSRGAVCVREVVDLEVVPQYRHNCAMEQWKGDTNSELVYSELSKQVRNTVKMSAGKQKVIYI